MRFLTITPADADWLPLSPVAAETMALSVPAVGPSALVRQQEPYVLLGPQDRRLPNLPAGVDYLRRRGLPVFERIGGGSAVLLDADCVSFAVARPCRDLGMIARNYDELTAGVRAALRRLGLAPAFGAAAGSFCEGPTDLLVGGRKIAGVAQALRQGVAAVSGMLLLRQDPVAATAVVNGFLAAAGGQPDRRADVVTSIAAELGRPLAPAELAAQLYDAFDHCFGLEPDSFTPAEQARARALVAQRRLA